MLAAAVHAAGLVQGLHFSNGVHCSVTGDIYPSQHYSAVEFVSTPLLATCFPIVAWRS